MSLTEQEREGEIFTEYQLGTSHRLVTLTFIVFFDLRREDHLYFTGEEAKAEGPRPGITQIPGEARPLTQISEQAE